MISGRRSRLSDPVASLAALLDLGPPEATEWMQDGVCAQTAPDAFFPGKGGSTQAAKAVCRLCPVRAECLEYAVDRVERFGIWGGLSERERRPLVRQRQTGPADRRAA